MTALRSELPELPSRMRSLHVDQRGYPIPWFCPWLDDEDKPMPDGEGRPEPRMMDQRKLQRAVREKRCWVCGGPLGRYRAFTIGPMCLVNGINAEPPSHVECADFSARACPFLSKPHMRRRDNNLPEHPEMAGVGLKRNPGAVVVYVTEKSASLKADAKGGVLFVLPDFTELRFYAEGRPATIEQVEQSVESGAPLLLDVCETDAERQEVLDRVAATLAKAAPWIDLD